MTNLSSVQSLTPHQDPQIGLMEKRKTGKIILQGADEDYRNVLGENVDFVGAAYGSNSRQKLIPVFADESGAQDLGYQDAYKTMVTDMKILAAKRFGRN